MPALASTAPRPDAMRTGACSDDGWSCAEGEAARTFFIAVLTNYFFGRAVRRLRVHMQVQDYERQNYAYNSWLKRPLHWARTLIMLVVDNRCFWPLGPYETALIAKS